MADDLVVIVADDGHGLLRDAGAAVTGMGITGMRSRVEVLGGTLEAGPGATGFVVRATIPTGADR